MFGGAVYEMTLRIMKGLSTQKFQGMMTCIGMALSGPFVGTLRSGLNLTLNLLRFIECKHDQN